MNKRTRTCIQCWELHTSEHSLRCITCQGTPVSVSVLRVAILEILWEVRAYDTESETALDSWAVFDLLRQGTECEDGVTIRRVQNALAYLSRDQRPLVRETTRIPKGVFYRAR